jgi:hypothetical protein
LRYRGGRTTNPGSSIKNALGGIKGSGFWQEDRGEKEAFIPEDCIWRREENEGVGPTMAVSQDGPPRSIVNPLPQSLRLGPVLLMAKIWKWILVGSPSKNDFFLVGVRLQLPV